MEARTDTLGLKTTPARKPASLLYKGGTVALVASAVLILLFKRPALIITVLEVIWAALFAAGFCLRAWPLLTRCRRTPDGTAALTLYHAVVLVLSGIPAKYMLSHALALPSSDFPITFAIWVLAAYPAVWLAGAALLSLATYAILLSTSILAHFSTQPPFDGIFRFLAHAFPVGSKWRSAFSDGRKHWSWRAFFDSLGAAVVSIIIAAAVGGWLQVIYQPRLVRLFAFIADYERAAAYPGVESARFKLHDNGIVSYATFSKGDVEIRVGRVGVPP